MKVCTEFSLIVPCFNEVLQLRRLQCKLGDCFERVTTNWEVIFVDDGSSDDSLDILRDIQKEDGRFKVLRLSRNFGQQAAICAGLSYSSGDAVGVIDADLQDPPAVLIECFKKVQGGYDVAYGVRKKRKEGLMKRTAYAIFYRLLGAISQEQIPADTGDFCVMSRKVVDVLNSMPERNVFLRGLRAWAGFRQIGIEYERDARSIGKSHYSLRKLVGLAADGIFSFSVLPLRIATFLGLLTVVLAIGMGVLTLVWRIGGFKLMGHSASELPGWTTVAGGMFFFGGVQLLLLGCIGEYIGRIYTEVKQRPRWVIQESLGFEPEHSRKLDHERSARQI